MNINTRIYNIMRLEGVAVTPNAGSNIQIKSYKHNGKVHRLWENNFVLKGAEDHILIANDKTRVFESDGRTWVTREPAICYFHTEYWFNIISMIRQDGIYYYCNISSPFVYDEGAIKYIDYDLDVKMFPDKTYIILDEDEFEEHKVKMKYPKVMDSILYSQMDILLSWIRQQKGPFNPVFVDEWYERFLTYR